MPIRTVGQPAGVAIPAAGNSLTTGVGLQNLAPFAWGGGFPVGADDGDDGVAEQYITRRIPARLELTNGKVLYFLEVRDGEQDVNSIGISVRVAASKSAEPGPETMVVQTPDSVALQTGNACPFENAAGEVGVVYCRDPKGLSGDPELWVTISDDDGATWGTPFEISTSVCVRLSGGLAVLPAGHSFPSGAQDNWVQCIIGPDGVAKRPAGSELDTIICMGYFRTAASVADQSQSWPFCFASEDGGYTWELRGGPPQTESNRMNEPVAVVLNSTHGANGGRIYCQGRADAGGNRMGMTSDDDGVTWSSVVRHTELTSPEVKGGLCQTRSGELYATYSGNGSYRKTMMVARSTDGGDNWTELKRIARSYIAYTGIDEISPNLFEIFGEFGNNGVHDGNAVDSTSRGLQRWRVTRDYLLDSTKVEQFKWELNEEPDGYSVPNVASYGASIPDHGGYNLHAMPQGSDLVYELVGGLAVMLKITSGYVRLHPYQETAINTFETTESFTFEFCFATTASSGRIFFAGSGTNYINVSIAANKLAFAIGDGTNEPVVLSAASVNDGLIHHAMCVRHIGDGKLYLYLDGVAAEAADTTTATVGGQYEPRLGQTSGGSDQFVGHIGPFHAHLEAFEAGDASTAIELLANRTSPSWLDTTPPSVGPGAISSLKMWIPTPPTDRELFFYEQGRNYPMARRNQGELFRSVLPYGDRMLWHTANPSTAEAASQRSVALIDDDGKFGTAMRIFTNASKATNGGLIGSGSASTSWIKQFHNDGLGSIAFWIKHLSSANIEVFDNLHDGGYGMSFTLLTDGRYKITLEKNSTGAFTSAYQTGLTKGEWNFIGIVFHGWAGAEPTYYRGLYTDASLTKVQLSGTGWAEPAGADADAGYDLIWGASNGASTDKLAGDMIAQPCMFDDELSDSDMDDIFQYGKGL